MSDHTEEPSSDYYLEEIEDVCQQQLDLFSLVDAPEKQLVKGKYVRSPYSNSIGSIDLIPRFKRGDGSVVAVSATIGKKLIIENRYRIGKNELICKIQPAVIERKVKGELVEFYAWSGDREELIEKILFLIASNRGLSKIKMPGGVDRYGIHFTLYEIRTQLQKIGKTRPYDVIREALIVIRDSNTTISQVDGTRSITITHDIFSDAVLEVSGTGRGRDRCSITFSDYIIEQIQQVNYRQYPFASINVHDTPLSRFIHHYLTNNWTNATPGVTRKIYVNEIFGAFGKNHLSMPVKRRDTRAALEILVKAGWFTNVPYSKKQNMNSNIDYYYEMTPTEVFVEEVVRANSKKKGLRIMEEKVRLDPSFILPLPKGEIS
tara:strand:+ start:27405 stop:28532 length:1128 start_codon:yes stop_codon:yes gene_type:complete